MLIKPFGPLLNTRKDPATMSYLGTVEDNNDPEKLGRIRVRISPYTDFKKDELPWASPMLGSHGNSSMAGGLNIPEIGAQVRITFPSQDLTAPYYSGAELNALNRITLFDENYPNAYGYKDSNGNFIKVDKTAGTTHWQHESTTNAQVTSDGSITINLRGGSSFSLSSYNMLDVDLQNVRVEADGNMGSVSIEAKTDLTISAKSIKLESQNISIKGDISTDGASGVLWLLNGIATVKDGLIVSINNNT